MLFRYVFGKGFALFLLLHILAGTSLAGATGFVEGENTLAGTPMEIRSRENDGLPSAEISGRVDFPFQRLSRVLISPESWCEFIPLVFNIKSCTHSLQDGRTLLNLYIGRKFYQTPEEADRLSYYFMVPELGKDRCRVLLYAPEGPYGTGDYRIDLEAREAAGGGTFLRLHTSYRPSLRSRLATRAYLSTAGRDKIGFSILGFDGEEPVYVGGVKGIIERNAMRYYLALTAFLETLELPAEKRFEARLNAWYEATEKYHRQLHEMDKKEYLGAKREEHMRQTELQERLTPVHAQRKIPLAGAGPG